MRDTKLGSHLSETISLILVLMEKQQFGGCTVYKVLQLLYTSMTTYPYLNQIFRRPLKTAEIVSWKAFLELLSTRNTRLKRLKIKVLRAIEAQRIALIPVVPVFWINIVRGNCKRVPDSIAICIEMIASNKGDHKLSKLSYLENVSDPSLFPKICMSV